MPSPLYQCTDRKEHTNVSNGNESAHTVITLTFKAIDPKSIGTPRPYFTLEGQFNVTFHDPHLTAGPSAEERARAFQLGGFYELSAVSSEKIEAIGLRNAAARHERP